MALEVIGTTAAISQLLGQAITLVQKIQEARDKVNGASERIDGYNEQLHNLLGTLCLVQNETELQTPAIEEQVRVIVGIGQELKDFLDSLAARQAKSKSRQYVHALASEDRDEKTLNNILGRLDRAKADLNMRITTTHVGLSGTMRDGFAAALAIVQRVDQNVQKVLGERLAIATQLDGRQSPVSGNGTVPLRDEDIRALKLNDKAEWIENKAYEDADMFNTDLVDGRVENQTERLYKGNEAHGKSFVLQGRADAKGIVEIIRARRGG